MSGEDGARHRPIMLHRAILGSFERFLGILIEQYAGRFPLWLAPVQAVVATIVSDADEYAAEVAAAFARAGLAVETDLTNQKINAKVREHSLAHVPVLAVVGRKEAEARTVALRRLGSQAQEILPLEEAVVETCIRGNTARSNFRQDDLILGPLFAQTTRRSLARASGGADGRFNRDRREQ